MWCFSRVGRLWGNESRDRDHEGEAWQEGVTCCRSMERRWMVAEDRRVVQCNYTEAVSEARAGARAYLVNPNLGNGADRIEILVRSRGGRWIEKWEDIRRLGDFRVKTLPPEHPLYGDDRLYPAEHADRFFGDVTRFVSAMEGRR